MISYYFFYWLIHCLFDSVRFMIEVGTYLGHKQDLKIISNFNYINANNHIDVEFLLKLGEKNSSLSMVFKLTVYFKLLHIFF